MGKYYCPYRFNQTKKPKVEPFDFLVRMAKIGKTLKIATLFKPVYTEIFFAYLPITFKEKATV
jgi:hypothetical protein